MIEGSALNLNAPASVAQAIRARPALLSLINVSSPRRFDERMLAAIKVYARARQALIITPFILSGAMSPVTVAGTLSQVLAAVAAAGGVGLGGVENFFEFGHGGSLKLKRSGRQALTQGLHLLGE